MRPVDGQLGGAGLPRDPLHWLSHRQAETFPGKLFKLTCPAVTLCDNGEDSDEATLISLSLDWLSTLLPFYLIEKKSILNLTSNVIFSVMTWPLFTYAIKSVQPTFIYTVIWLSSNIMRIYSVGFWPHPLHRQPCLCIIRLQWQKSQETSAGGL